MITRTLNVRHVLGPVLGIAGFALAFVATSNASAQDGAAPGTTPPAASTAPATTPAPAPAESEDESKKKAATPEAAAPAAPADGAAPAAPAAAPAAAAGTGVSVSVGGSSDPTKKDEPTKAGEKKDEPAPAPNPWRGSLLIFDQSASTNTFSKSAQLSYQPSYEWWISPRIAYNFNKVRLTVRQDLFKEFTNQIESTDRGEWRYTDTWLTLGHRTTLDSISKKLGLSLSFLLRPGISKESRIASQYFAAGPGIGLSYSFDLAGEKAKAFKSANISFASTYQHAFTRCNVPCSDSFAQPGMNTAGDPVTNNKVRMGSMTGNQLLSALTAGFDIVEHLDFSAMMIMISQVAYGTSDASVRGVEVARSDNDTRVRQFSWFLASLTYGVTKEVSVAAGYWNFNNVLGPDGQYRNPFWSPEARVFLDVMVHFDAIYERMQGGEGKKGATGTGSGRVF